MKRRRIGKHISIAYRFAMVFFKNKMAELGLHQSHHSVLITLYKNEGISQESLSKLLKVDKATITRSIKKLVEDGFIERKQDVNDKRSYLLFVTKKGRDIEPSILDMFKEWNDIALEGFNDEEVEQAVQLMERISQNVLNHHYAGDLKQHCIEREEYHNESK